MRTAYAYGVDGSEIVAPSQFQVINHSQCVGESITHHLDVGKLELITGLDILLLPDVWHVTPIIDAILIIRRV